MSPAPLMMIVWTMPSPEKCKFCIRGLNGHLGKFALLCEWCNGRSMVLIDRGYMKGDEDERSDGEESG